jgi:hypothetical protein
MASLSAAAAGGLGGGVGVYLGLCGGFRFRSGLCGGCGFGLGSGFRFRSGLCGGFGFGLGSGFRFRSDLCGGFGFGLGGGIGFGLRSGFCLGGSLGGGFGISGGLGGSFGLRLGGGGGGGSLVLQGLRDCFKVARRLGRWQAEHRAVRPDHRAILGQRLGKAGIVPSGLNATDSAVVEINSFLMTLSFVFRVRRLPGRIVGQPSADTLSRGSARPD